MKIGFSLSQCVIDILEGVVQFDEVLVIISSTNFDPADDDQWAGIWRGYTNERVWRNYSDRESDFRALALRLYKNGRLHQPRQFGCAPPSGGSRWMEVVHVPMGIDEYPAVKQAWDAYQTVAGLCNTGTIYPADRMEASKEIKPRTPEEQEKYEKSIALLASCIC